MARPLTYFSLIALSAAVTLGACGKEGGKEDSDGGTDADADADSDEDEDSDISVGDGDGPLGDDIRYESPPQGFLSTIDDGSGNPTYVEAGIALETVNVLAAAAAAGLTPAAGATFDYPLTDTMVPANLTFLEFQWRGPDGAHTKALIRITSPDTVYHVYVNATCTSTGYCKAAVPAAEWQTVGATHPGQTVTVEVISTNGTDSVITQPLPVRFSPEPLIGALYYWASASRVIKRVSFGAEAATDFIIPSAHTEYECVSCHSVSRDGSTIAFGVAPEHGENISAIQVTSTKDPNIASIKPTMGTTAFSSVVYDQPSLNPERNGPVDSLGHNVALSRDGSVMAVNATSPPENWPSRLEIRGTSAADTVLAAYEVGHAVFGADKLGIHPEYSPDGTQLVVTLAESDGNMSAWSNTTGSIAVLPVNPDGSLGSARVVSVPAVGAFHFYPTWSPDSKYIAFMTSWDPNFDPASGHNVGSLGNDHAVMHMVLSSGNSITCPGPDCLELTRGTGYTGAAAMAMTGTTGSTWPKFAPFAQGANKNVYFITFTSRRPVGANTAERTQLWMFGVDTTSSPDMSFSPFWLPYQEPTDGSLAPYWTEVLPCDIEGGTCNGCLADKEYCLVNQEVNSCRCEAYAGVK